MSSALPPPTPTPEALQVKIANLGVIAALLVALVGAIITGIFLLTSTNRQLSGETEKSRAEFLRAQRQTLYARVMTDSRAFQSTEGDMVNAVSSNNIKRARMLDKSVLALDNKLSADRDVVEVLGSYNAVQATRSLFFAHEQLQQQLERHLNGKSLLDTLVPQASGAALTASQVDISNAFGDFTNVARADMGAGPS